MASIICSSRHTDIAGTEWAASTTCSGAARPRLRRGAERGPAVERMPWWRTAVLYQIYPRSFQDADGNGVGGLRGIAQRLPYLNELTSGAVYVSPRCPS